MPKIAEIEMTPNPNARKFILKEALTGTGVTRSYDAFDKAQDDPLAKELFTIPHVTNVFYTGTWVTVTQDGRAEWNDLIRQVAQPIRDAKAEDVRRSAGGDAPKAQREETDPETMARLVAIDELLDKDVRPALQRDGGDVEVIGIVGDRIKIHYFGACGTCPSSTFGTLHAIEQLIRTIEPDLRVVAV